MAYFLEATRTWPASFGPDYAGKTYTTKASNSDIKRALGVEPTKHWPDNELRGSLNGVALWVLAKGFTMVNNTPTPTKNRIARRTYAQCPKCSGWYCAGHIDQHMHVHREG